MISFFDFVGFDIAQGSLLELRINHQQVNDFLHNLGDFL